MFGAFAAAVCGTSTVAPRNHNAAVATSTPSLRKPVFIMSPHLCVNKLIGRAIRARTVVQNCTSPILPD